MNSDASRQHMMSIVMYTESVPSQLGELLASLHRSLTEAVSSRQFSFEACQDAGRSIWTETGSKIINKHGMRKYNIGSTDDKNIIMSSVQAMGNDAIYAMIESWHIKNLRWSSRFDWMISWSAAQSSSVQSFGHCVLVNVRLSALASCEPVYIDNLVRDIWKACDKHASIVSGLVDICHVNETSDGLAYHQLSRAASWHRSIERRVSQLHRGDLDRRVRGIYWGTVISAHAMSRIGAISNFASEYGQFFQRWRPRPSSLVHELSNGGVFVQLSPSLRDVWPNTESSATHYNEIAIDAAAWLHEYLRDRNLLL
jgi:hypothetical protein